MDGDVGQPKLQLPVKSSDVAEPKKAQAPAKAGDDDFLAEFYGRSRLHHLSTMGALFKRYVADLKDKRRGRDAGAEVAEVLILSSNFRFSLP